MKNKKPLKYENLSKRMQKALLERHDHACSVVKRIHPEEVVYLEKDVIELIMLAKKGKI